MNFICICISCGVEIILSEPKDYTMVRCLKCKAEFPVLEEAIIIKERGEIK